MTKSLFSLILCFAASYPLHALPALKGCTGDLRPFADDRTPPQVGYKAADGTVIVAPIFEAGRSFCSGLAAVKQKGLWGFIDKAGEVVIPFQFAEATYFSEGVAPVQSGKRWTFITTKGAAVCPATFLYASPFADGLAPVKYLANDLLVTDYVDHACRLVSKGQYDEAKVFSDGLGAVKKNGLWNFVNKQGIPVAKLGFSSHAFIPGLSGLVAVQSQGKWGFINGKGAWVFYPQIDELYGCYEEQKRIIARVGEAWGALDYRLAWVIPPTYQQALTFETLAKYAAYGPVARVRYQIYLSKSEGKLFTPVPRIRNYLVDRTQYIDVWGRVVDVVYDLPVF